MLMLMPLLPPLMPRDITPPPDQDFFRFSPITRCRYADADTDARYAAAAAGIPLLRRRRGAIHVVTSYMPASAGEARC